MILYCKIAFSITFFITKYALSLSLSLSLGCIYIYMFILQKLKNGDTLIKVRNIIILFSFLAIFVSSFQRESSIFYTSVEFHSVLHMHRQTQHTKTPTLTQAHTYFIYRASLKTKSNQNFFGNHLIIRNHLSITSTSLKSTFSPLSIDTLTMINTLRMTNLR